MIAYIIEIQKTKFAYILFREFDQSEPGCQIKFRVYFHHAGYIYSHPIFAAHLFLLIL